MSDENGNPVAGASVNFGLPETGPSGVFADGSKSQLVADQGGRPRQRVGDALEPSTRGGSQVRVVVGKGAAPCRHCGRFSFGGGARGRFQPRERSDQIWVQWSMDRTGNSRRGGRRHSSGDARRRIVGKLFFDGGSAGQPVPVGGGSFGRDDDSARRASVWGIREALPNARDPCSAGAQGGIGRPFLGQMIDGQSRLRPVYGVSGNFTLDQTQTERVLASACSAVLCLAKTSTAEVSARGVTEAPRGGAVIALDATGATVYFPEIRQFARWQNGSLTKLGLSVEGTVLSMASTATGLSIAVLRNGLIWIVTPDGSLLDVLPDGASAALLLPTLTIYATGDSVVLRKIGGSELRFLPGVTSLSAMGDGYVEPRRCTRSERRRDAAFL